MATVVSLHHRESQDSYDFRKSQGGFMRGPRDTRKSLDIPMGQSETIIRIKARGATDLEQINFRLVNRHQFRFWRFKDADPDVVHIESLRDIIYSTEGMVWGRSYFESSPDTVGGQDGMYSETLHLIEGQWLWFCVHANAAEPWQGFLAFEGAFDDRRAWGRIATQANPLLAPDIGDRKCLEVEPKNP